MDMYSMSARSSDFLGFWLKIECFKTQKVSASFLSMSEAEVRRAFNEP